MLDQKTVQTFFDYKNGELFWKIDRGNNIKRGDIAGSIYERGYKRVSVNNRRFPVHKIVWLYHNGYLPKLVDHINGNPSDNRIENLREVTNSQNCFNRRIALNNTSGSKNVCFDKKSNKWKVYLTVSPYRNKYFGSYSNKDIAITIATLARHKYHGNFANNGQR